MFPLNLTDRGHVRVVRVLGNDETKKRLEDLGFFPEQEIEILNKVSDSLIVRVGESRIALDETGCGHVFVEDV